jgi:hypothetical protein
MFNRYILVAKACFYLRIGFIFLQKNKTLAVIYKTGLQLILL